MTALKLIHSEAQMELDRKAEIKAVEDRIAERSAKIAALRMKAKEATRQMNDEDWSLKLDQNRLHQLINNRAKPITQPLEEGPEE
jgi:hypothetical protein